MTVGALTPRVQLVDQNGYPTSWGFRFLQALQQSADSTGTVTLTGVQTLTNKTMDGDDNTFTDIHTSSLKTVSGNTGTVVTGTAGANTDLGQWDAAGNLLSLPLASVGSAIGAQPLDADLTSWAGVTRASGFDTFAATPSSANLISLVTDETGSGALVFGTGPTIGGATITTGTIDNTPIGATTQNTGKFTSLIATVSVQVPSYTVVGLPSAATAGQVIYVSNESGGAVLAFSDGANWLRSTDRAVVS